MEKIGVPFVVVEADSGNIGGNRSQEVHIVSPIGPREDSLLSCECGSYAANIEKAIARDKPDLFGKAEAGDPSPCDTCRSPLVASEGIEVGHCFYLGTKYSEALGAKFTPQHGGKPIATEMGCYGLGVTRMIGAVAEASHDEKGIIWPDVMAPYKATIVVLDTKNDQDVMLAEVLYDTISKGVAEMSGEICIDDRAALSPGVKLKDAELVGFPYVLVVGKAYRKTGEIELQIRRTGKRILGQPPEILAELKGILEKEHPMPAASSERPI